MIANSVSINPCGQHEQRLQFLQPLQLLCSSLIVFCLLHIKMEYNGYTSISYSIGQVGVRI